MSTVVFFFFCKDKYLVQLTKTNSGFLQKKVVNFSVNFLMPRHSTSQLTEKLTEKLTHASNHLSEMPLSTDNLLSDFSGKFIELRLLFQI
jgi:hypothetical protein